jgi:phosphoglycolate phosphatase-like HAD superfamily hydrolase
MKPLILLDFDGVLFNSAYEAYQVCEELARTNGLYRKGLSFDEFMEFRAHLTDAWQFCRLYQGDRLVEDLGKLHTLTPDQQDWDFATRFFEARKQLMKDRNWAKLMSPYPFFYQLRPLLTQYPASFKVLSTRNVESIQRTFDFFEVEGIEIYGQENIRRDGSKLGVARRMAWLGGHQYVVYIDDMNSHLEPFENEVDLCIHAGWGYDHTRPNSFTQGLAFKLIHGFLRLAHE